MHWVNECLPELVRKALNLKEKPYIKAIEYADDIPFLAESKDVLHQVFKFIKEYIEEELELSIKGNYQIFPIAKNRYCLLYTSDAADEL